MKTKDIKTGEVGIKVIKTLFIESVASLIRHGESHTYAEKLAREFVLSVLKKLDRISIYFPQKIELAHQLKRDAIRHDFWAGCTVFELAKKYQLTNVRIYQILRKKEKECAESDTSGEVHIFIGAARMFLQSGLEKEDATNAARGLAAVILTRLRGICTTVPGTERVNKIITNIQIWRAYRTGKSITGLAGIFNLPEDEIQAAIEQQRAIAISEADVNGLTLLKRKVLEVANTFKEMSPEAGDLLERTAENFDQAQTAFNTSVNGQNRST